MDERIRNLIFQAIDQTISRDDFERLQDAIEQDAEVRAEYLRAVHLGESLSEIAAKPLDEAEAPFETHDIPQTTLDKDIDRRRLGRLSAGQLAVAAMILIATTAIAFQFGQRNVAHQPLELAGPEGQVEENSESLIAGHGTLRRSLDLRWRDGTPAYREGDVLPTGTLQLDAGIAEIDLFCGATLMVEGPAVLEIESDWSARLVAGRLRANVPPAARGFIVKAADSEIIDLGTEFDLEVGPENVRVEVVDGEVELRGGDHDGVHLLTGEGEWLRGTAADPEEPTLSELTSIDDVQRRRASAEQLRFEQWKATSLDLRRDERLIAYFPIADSTAERFVPNAALTGSQLDGALVGLVDRVRGRFGEQSTALEFKRPGARVRMRIDGEFEAFTFACWVRIDSLEHRYNALFMGDGYENGEPHWQIRDDGRLMFSVMVDDTQDIRHFNEIDQRVVRQAGLHRVYYTEPIWDISKSGQWFHLAAVYDPIGRRVQQFVNGVELSNDTIDDKFHIASLRIGPAEIGNWGQPFRETPWFAVRHLNGAIDELAIFNAALKAEEIQTLYEQGKPLGY